jgi:predicted permease
VSLAGILIDVVGPVFLLAAIGYGWARRGEHFDTVFVGLLVNSVGTPALVLDSLLNSSLDLRTLGQMALGAFLCMGIAMALGYVFVRAQGLAVSTFLPTLVWSNGGNMGLPLTLFAFGERGLALAIAWFALSSISNYTLGQAIAAGGLSFATILRMPIMWAVVIVVFSFGTGLRPPGVFMRAAHLLAGVSVPLMLISLGHSLAKLHVGALPRSALFATARLGGGFAIGWGIATLLGLTGVERGVLVTQSAMPSAVLNYLFAARYSSQAEDVAGIVVVSTLMSVVLLPIFLSTVL